MRLTIKTKAIGIFFVALTLIVLCQAAVYLVMLGGLHRMKGFYTDVMNQSEKSDLEHLFYHEMLAMDEYLLFPDDTRRQLLTYADNTFEAKLNEWKPDPDGKPERTGLLEQMNELKALLGDGSRLAAGQQAEGPGAGKAAAGIGRIERVEKNILAGIEGVAPGEQEADAQGEKDASLPGPSGKGTPAFMPALEGALDIGMRTYELLEYQAIRNLSMRKKNASRRFLLTGEERYVKEFQGLDSELVSRIDALSPEIEKEFGQEAASIKYAKESNGLITAAFGKAVRQYRSGEKKEAAASVMAAYINEEMLDTTVSDLVENETIQFKSAYSSLDPMMKYSVLFTRTLFVYLLSVVGVLAILVYEAVSRMTKPIVRLSEVSRRVAQGDWTQRLEVVGKDEIGVMAASFNSMTEQLEKSQKDLLKRHAELSALYDASVALNSTLDLDTLLEEVLKAVTGLEMFEHDVRGSIFIVEGGKMRRISATGPAPCPDGIDVGECLCSLAAKTNEIVISDDSVGDENHTLGKPGMASHGHVVLPLRAMDKVVGVLYLYTNAGVGIDENRKKLLYILGGQIGTAISNAKLYEETKALSLKDSLTGLANRRMMDILLGKSFDRARRLGSPFSVIMLDIDHFKKYNDTFGHPAGDALLAKLAGILLGEVREIDLVVRYGGEEFFILLPEASAEEAGKVAERIRARVQSDSPVTVSLGVSAYRAGTGAKEDIVRQADEALYRAKRDGRNRVEVYDIARVA